MCTHKCGSRAVVLDDDSNDDDDNPAMGGPQASVLLVLVPSLEKKGVLRHKGHQG